MNVLGVEYDNLTFDEALGSALGLLKKDGKSCLFFLNADCLGKAQRDEEYRSILNAADLLLPDGVALRAATAVFGGRMKANCNGTDFSPPFMERAAREGYKLFFLGGREGVAETAAARVKQKIEGIRIVGCRSGYFDDDGKVVDEINRAGADILFVAMGAPLQEKWIAKNRDRLNPKLSLGVGALLDYLSGRIPRAPLFLRRAGLEWLWRVLIEPRRMFKRYLIDGAYFCWLVLRKRCFCRDP